MRTNPGKTMTIYDIPRIVNYALPLAATPANIMNSFLHIWAYDSNVFTEEDYAPSYVTDRLLTSTNNENNNDVIDSSIQLKSSTSAIRCL